MNTHVTNGRQTMLAQISYNKIGPTKANEPLPFEQKNWLIYTYYVRDDFITTRYLIEKELERSYYRNVYAYYINAKMYKDEGNLQESLEKLQMCHKLNPTNVKFLKEIGNCLYLLKRYRLALEAYIEAENLIEKSDWEIFFNIGKCLLKLKVPDKALEYVTRAAQLSQQEETFILLNKLLISKEDYVTSIEVCNNALEFCPESVEILTELGLSHIRLGQSQLAFERLGSALALEPFNHNSLLAIGCIIQNYGDFDVALSKYRIAAQNIPQSSALWNNIGLCFYAKQKYVGAISCLLRSLWISPLNWRILYNLGLVHLSTHQPASAFHFLCASVNLKPDYSLSFMLLGIALCHLNDLENSHRAFEQAATLSPNDLSVCLNYAISLEQKGEFTVEQLVHLKEIIDASTTDIDQEILSTVDKLSTLLSLTTENTNTEEFAEIVDVDVEPKTKYFNDPNEV